MALSVINVDTEFALDDRARRACPEKIISDCVIQIEQLCETLYYSYLDACDALETLEHARASNDSPDTLKTLISNRRQAKKCVRQNCEAVAHEIGRLLKNLPSQQLANDESISVLMEAKNSLSGNSSNILLFIQLILSNIPESTCATPTSTPNRFLRIYNE